VSWKAWYFFQKGKNTVKKMTNKIDNKVQQWINGRVKASEIEKYLDGGKSFINPGSIEKELALSEEPRSSQVRDILAKSLSIETLSIQEAGALMRVRDQELIEEMKTAALAIKRKVYDNRIVVFAPLYLGSFCVNDCLYCGFRASNAEAQRRVLNREEILAETRVLAGNIGHKRLIVVYGEHPSNDIDYMVDTIQTIYSVGGQGEEVRGRIRRVNVNAPTLSIAELSKLKNAGIGTYQVFQETYHPGAYRNVHPASTIKGDYLWRLYSMHRALDAGVDDVGLGALFGLYDWRFDVMGLLTHNIELEKRFGIGAHTISFPRLEPALNTPYTENPRYKVSDSDFRKLMLIIRLAVPHTGMIITCRETAAMKKESLYLGVTQTDASSKIGIGAYSDGDGTQAGARQQFMLGDTRSLQEMIREFASLGFITSFCTAGYRCGRTGECIMGLLREGKEGKFCKLNAVITFREWLDDFADNDTRSIAEPLILKEIEEIKKTNPAIFSQFMKYYLLTKEGERDLYF
jgi:2-iminoacetate synthase